MKKLALLLTLCGLLVCHAGQCWDKNYCSSIGLTVKASSNGAGGEFYYRLQPRFTIRAGYEYLRFKIDHDFDQRDIQLSGKIRYRTGSLFVGATYQFLGWMYVNGGVGWLNFEPTVKAASISGFEYGDIVLKPDVVGDIRFTIKPRLRVAPYLGIGFGRIAPRHRTVSFAFELGAYYMGKPKIDIQATGMLAPSMEADRIALLEHQIRDYRLYPVLKFNLSFKLFTFKKK